MKLATFRHEGKKSVGLALDDPILALSAARPRDMIGFLWAGGPALQATAPGAERERAPACARRLRTLRRGNAPARALGDRLQRRGASRDRGLGYIENIVRPESPARSLS
jgi:hypothetical protein